MSQESLIAIIHDAQRKQNEIAQEVAEYLRAKQKELIPLTKMVLTAQDQLERKYNDADPHEITSKAWNLIFDMSEGGKIFGYNMTPEEIKEILEDAQ